MPIAAAYFDGKSPQPTKGGLEVAHGNLVFTSEAGLPAYIDISLLKEPSPAAEGKLLLEGSPAEGETSSPRFLVLASAFRKQLRPEIRKVRPGYGGGGNTGLLLALAVLAVTGALAWWQFG